MPINVCRDSVQWKVRYTIADADYEQGPWDFDEAVKHLKDIREYMGIVGARLVPSAKAETETDKGNQTGCAD